MLGCFALGLSGYFLKDAIKSSWPTFIFCLEALGLMSFGLSWLTAIRVLPITTHREERFGHLLGRAPEDSRR